jgi:hypothetical protein
MPFLGVVVASQYFFEQKGLGRRCIKGVVAFDGVASGSKP